MSRIAIALATYNGAAYIAEQLDSLRRQTYTDWRCYIHDDGSTDSTVEIIDEWCARDPEHFVRLDYTSTHGPTTNFMSLLDRITEERHIMFCDQDDVWNNDKITCTYERMQEIESRYGTERPALVFSDVTVVDQDLRTIASSFYENATVTPQMTTLRDIYITNCAPGCTMMINKALRDCAIRVEAPERLPMHDVWLMMIAASAGEIAFIDQPLMQYRQHGDNCVGADKLTTWDKLRNVLIGDVFRQVAGSIARRRDTMRQLQALHLNGISDADQVFIDDVVQIGTRPKWERVIFCHKNHLYRGSGIMALLCC